jgi:ribonucleotide reductase alpha subunit
MAETTRTESAKQRVGYEVVDNLDTRETYLNTLRPLLDGFFVKVKVGDKDKEVYIYETGRILEKLRMMPSYVAEETIRGLLDQRVAKEHYKVLLDKWGKKDSETKRFVETPEMVFYRAALLAAEGLARDGESPGVDLVPKIFDRFVNKEIFPNTPYMANGGHRLLAEQLETRLSEDANPSLINEIEQEKRIREQLFACFVLDIFDSRESIFGTMGEAAAIQASIGGTGFNFSNLRPANETLHGTGGITDGPVSFMAMYSNALGQTMNQGGKREGANMFMLDWNHPDLSRFIYSKSTDGTVSAANISIAVDHDFMKAAKAEGEERFYPLKNPHHNPKLRPHIPANYSEEQLKQAAEVVAMNKKSTQSLILSPNGVDVLSPWLPEGLDEEYRVIGKVKDGTVYLDAKKVLRHIAFGAWFNGEPGVITIGHINDHNPTHPRNFRQFLLDQKDQEAVEIVGRLKQKNPGRSLEILVDSYIEERDEEGRQVNLPVGVGEMRATNPCGEKPLLGNEACVLGHTNLERILDLSNSESSGYRVNLRKLEETTRLLVRILDNAIDQNYFTNLDIERTQKSNRKIGVGFMGLANMLYKLELPYNSQEARDVVNDILKVWEEVSDDESFKRGENLGVFPNFKFSHHKDGKPKRNAIVRTIAPTGTTAFAAQTTGGMEPEYALAYTRETVQGTKVEMFNPVLQEKLEKYKFLITEEEIKKFNNFIQEMGNGSLQGFEIQKGTNETEAEFRIRQENLAKIKRIFVTTYDINPEDHLRMQAVVQSHVDDSISKTTNFRNNTTVEDVERAFVLAYDLGIKGITFYRDGTRKDQPLQVKGSSNKKGLEGIISLTDNALAALSRPRPELVGGLTRKEQTPFGLNAFVTLNWEKDPQTGEDIRPYEVFVGLGKAGADLPAIAEGYGRLISLALKVGVPVDYIKGQLEGIGGETQVGFGEGKVKSLPDAIAIALQKELQDKARISGKEIKKDKKNGNSGNLCPSCGKTLVYLEGCEKCSCGFSKC